MKPIVKNVLIGTGAAAATTVAIDLLNKQPVGTTAKGIATGTVDLVKGLFSKTAEVATDAAEAVADVVEDAAN